MNFTSSAPHAAGWCWLRSWLEHIRLWTTKNSIKSRASNPSSLPDKTCPGYTLQYVHYSTKVTPRLTVLGCRHCTHSARAHLSAITSPSIDADQLFSRLKTMLLWGAWVLPSDTLSERATTSLHSLPVYLQLASVCLHT